MVRIVAPPVGEPKLAFAISPDDLRIFNGSEHELCRILSELPEPIPPTLTISTVTQLKARCDLEQAFECSLYINGFRIYPVLGCAYDLLKRVQGFPVKAVRIYVNCLCFPGNARLMATPGLSPCSRVAGSHCSRATVAP